MYPRLSFSRTSVSVLVFLGLVLPSAPAMSQQQIPIRHDCFVLDMRYMGTIVGAVLVGSRWQSVAVGQTG